MVPLSRATSGDYRSSKGCIGTEAMASGSFSQYSFSIYYSFFGQLVFFGKEDLRSLPSLYGNKAAAVLARKGRLWYTFTKKARRIAP